MRSGNMSDCQCVNTKRCPALIFSIAGRAFILTILLASSMLYAVQKNLDISFDQAKWIWDGAENTKPAASASAGTFYFQKGFVFPAGAKPVAGEVIITCDNLWVLYVNGEKVGRNDPAPDSWRRPQRIDLSRNLRIEQNSIAVKAVNTVPGPAGLIVKIKAVFENGNEFELSSDQTWISSEKADSGWNENGFTPGQGWLTAKVAGVYGCAPWGKVTPGVADSSTIVKNYKK